jgi:hypothetical protein
MDTVTQYFFVHITHCNVQKNKLSFKIAALKPVSLTPNSLFAS